MNRAYRANHSAVLHTERLKRLAASSLAIAVCLAPCGPAIADITNTVTVTGSSPGNANDVTAADTENVSPVLAAPGMSVTKAFSFTDSGSAGAEPGDVITYTYTVTNTGNVPVTAITLSDTDNSASPDLVPAFVALVNTSGNSSNPENDNTVEVLWPGDQATFTATLTVTQADVDTLQ